MRNALQTNLSNLMAAAAAAILLFANTACATTGADHDRNVGTNIPVLVMGEDEDPNTVKRSSDIFKRVNAELKGAMQRHGFRMIDEESVAVDLGWEITERRPKTELIEGIKLMNKSGNASHRVRAWVLFRIHAQAKDLEFSTKVQTRIDGEIYDAASNQFLDTFEMPRAEYPAPADCLESPVCITEVVGDRARDIAAGLGEVLARKLERYEPGMLLPPGSYRVEANAEGYEMATESVSHGAAPTVRRLALRKAGPKAGDRFRDCPECPEMVVLPAGSYRMGSPSYEQGRQEDEGPVHEVTIAAPFALGVHEVTVAEFGRFVDETAYSAGSSCFTYEGGNWADRAGRGWRNPGFGQSGRHPVACVRWDDAQAYAAWLSRETGEEYRLPSESEWEYAARAGTATARYWGEGESGQCRHANGGDASTKERYSGWPLASCRDGHVHTAPAGSLTANGWGLHDMLGNVSEWTEDCWNGSYAGAPSDGSAWEYGECDRRVLRGGSWIFGPSDLRAAVRDWGTSGLRNSVIGFRVARTLTP